MKKPSPTRNIDTYRMKRAEKARTLRDVDAYHMERLIRAIEAVQYHLDESMYECSRVKNLPATSRDLYQIDLYLADIYRTVKDHLNALSNV